VSEQDSKGGGENTCSSCVGLAAAQLLQHGMRLRQGGRCVQGGRAEGGRCAQGGSVLHSSAVADGEHVSCPHTVALCCQAHGHNPGPQRILQYIEGRAGAGGGGG
jgi:hypothetical protein